MECETKPVDPSARVEQLSAREIWDLTRDSYNKAAEKRERDGGLLRQLGCTTGTGLAVKVGVDVATSFAGTLGALFAYDYLKGSDNGD